ncbi:MAG TPA: glycosyltransferase [Gemmatimonadaceae bacterium]|nr:glycosyltransferase [Gemmatimonadaceae bacterium]
MNVLGAPTLSWEPRQSGGGEALRRAIAGTKPDVVFIPTARWLDCGSTPVVSMVRNMEPLVMPFSPRHPAEIARNLARRLAAYSAVKRSDAVIAVSGFVQSFLLERWSVARDKTAVIYHGVDSLVPPEGSSAASIDSLTGTRFVFTAGSIRPSRGLEDAIESMIHLAVAEPRFVLGIAGNCDKNMEWYHRTLREKVSRLGLSERVRWLGALDPEAMTWAFRHSEAFIMTSRTEACPNVALEAMAQGCACISTEIAPMPEIFRDAASYYPAGDAETLASRVIDSRNDSHMRDRAKERAKVFSWDATTRATVAFLETTIANAQPGLRSRHTDW